MVIEWAPFRLAAGEDEARLFAASEALQRDFLSKQPGFVRRELLRGKDGDWVDLVYWRDGEAADAAMQRASESAACAAYFHLMEAEVAQPGAGVAHFRQVRTYG